MISDRSAIIISASSDIGMAISQHWLTRDWKIFGTYRTRSQAVNDLAAHGVSLVHCDLSDSQSVNDACSQLRKLCPNWNVLALCPGMLDPIGAFADCNFPEWEESVKVNFTSQMRIIHELLPTRHGNSVVEPSMLLFAGGGTNDAPVNYSAYTASKVALIKMCELLAAEIPDARFVIVGPGWVKTKMHDSTLGAGARAGANYHRTVERLSSDKFTSMDEVLDCCDWLIEAPRGVMNGRNFSVTYDMWGTEELASRLIEEPNMYKLRRHGNDWMVKNAN